MKQASITVLATRLEVLSTPSEYGVAILHLKDGDDPTPESRKWLSPKEVAKMYDLLALRPEDRTLKTLALLFEDGAKVSYNPELREAGDKYLDKAGEPQQVIRTHTQLWVCGIQLLNPVVQAARRDVAAAIATKGFKFNFAEAIASVKVEPESKSDSPPESDPTADDE